MLNITVKIPQELRTILEAIAASGGTSYIAGGAVRDSILGLTPKDFDVEVFGVTVALLNNVLQGFTDYKVSTVGKQFGIFKVTTDTNVYDFSLPRRESKIGINHTDFLIDVDPQMTFREACSRRDFTINAMLFNPLTEELIDPFNGLSDLKGRILGATSDKFKEDPLRVLRGMQLASRFHLKVTKGTSCVCFTLKDQYPTISKERVWEEWFKWAVSSIPSIGLSFLEKTQWLDLYPELVALTNVPQNPEYHPEGDVWTHTNFVVNAAARVCDRQSIQGEDRAVIVFAALCHDLGKPYCTVTDSQGKIRSSGHEKDGEAPTRAFLESIGCLERIIERVVPLVGSHLAHLSCQTPSAVRRLAKRLTPATIQELGWVIEADHSGRPPLPQGVPAQAASMLAIALNTNCTFHPVAPLIMGRDLIALGVKPGKALGALLAQLQEAQLDGKFSTWEEGIRFFKDNLLPLNN